MITLLHTADWHLGASLQGWPREAEQRDALAQLVAIAKDREVDAVVVAGDVFDSLNPSAEAQRLLFETLRDLRAARPHATIALVAGNHDPAGRLEAPRALFDLAGVVSVGTIARQTSGADAGAIDSDVHLIPLRDAAGRVGAHLLAVPYPRAADLPLPTEAVAGSSIVWGVRALYAQMIALARRDIGAAPLVVTGHLHVAGGLESEGAERRILVGGEHAIPPDVFPSDVAYVALGHLHRPQCVGREIIRYSGSLVPMSKTEIDYVHGVSLVTIDDASNVAVEHVPLMRSVPCLRVPERGALAPGDVENAFAALGVDPTTPVEQRPFVHLAVKVDGPAVGLKAEIDAGADKFPIRLVSLSLERPQAAGVASEPSTVRLSERQPVDLFREAYERAHRVAPTSEHLRLFDKIAREE